MSLLTIVQGFAVSVGLPNPTAVIGANERTWIEVTEHANAAGEELARRVDWGQLTLTTTLTGTGTNAAHTLPSGFDRIAKGQGVYTTQGPVRPLTQAEWATLTPVEGVPRYFILRDDKISLWPHLATGQAAAVSYQTEAWCDNGTGSWAADDDVSLIDEALFQKAVEVRWRRAKGMDYADFEAEYEATLRDYARNNDRSRL